MNKVIAQLILLSFFLSANINAQENSGPLINNDHTEQIKPSVRSSLLKDGRPIIEVFSNFHHAHEKAGEVTEFQLTRAYLGYHLFYVDNYSAKVVFDVAPPSDQATIDYHTYLKEASLTYKTSNLRTSVGVIEMSQFALIQEVWGYRYVISTLQDRNRLGPLNDLGGIIDYSFGKTVSIDVTLSNGEGGTKIKHDTKIKYAGGLTIKPFDGLIFRGYSDYTNYEDTTKITASGFMAFHRPENFSVGIEMSYQLNNKYNADHSAVGVSIFGHVHIHDYFSVFARYDEISTNVASGELNPWQITNSGQTLLGGFEYSPIEFVKLSLNVQYAMHKTGFTESELSYFFNLKYSF
ncbi:MAG: hypothetical protein KAG96_05355 [Ichthyobacteriaceae bacterium]|nr:hypothetical protein [Ichthyobacteriaceae bacterium]